MTVPITIAYGDGIGPEIMEATLHILDKAKANISPEIITVGEEIYKNGISSGIEASSWNSLRKNKVLLKAPITTPQGGGVKSLNVTIRKTLGLYANVRPCVAYAPFINTKHPDMNVVIIRENEEDLYAGIEHQQTHDVVQCLKLISRPGSERIIRYAFEYAKLNNRKKVTCFSKDNIMKLSDGLFHQVFDEIAKEYPEIQSNHMIIDIGTARLANHPEAFDVIVTLNLYGDIISDVAAEITGSVGLGGSANVGDSCAMFEAIHGSAPDIAGQGIANPSGLILGAVMMLVHINQCHAASVIHNAWLRTIEDGIHSGDIYNTDLSKDKVGTKAFADAVVQRLDQLPRHFTPVSYREDGPSLQSVLHSYNQRERTTAKPKRSLVGVDVFVFWEGKSADELAKAVQNAETEHLTLRIITTRGTKVWPDGQPETMKTDHWRCRFNASNALTNDEITKLLQQLTLNGIEFIKVENLYNFGANAGFTKAQGE